jgi:hypothetical protein
MRAGVHALPWRWREMMPTIGIVHLSTGRGTRHVQLVRGRDETCPVSTGGGIVHQFSTSFTGPSDPRIPRPCRARAPRLSACRAGILRRGPSRAARREAGAARAGQVGSCDPRSRFARREANLYDMIMWKGRAWSMSGYSLWCRGSSIVCALPTAAPPDRVSFARRGAGGRQRVAIGRRHSGSDVARVWMSVQHTPPPRTNWTRLVPPSVLTGHVWGEGGGRKLMRVA